MSRSLVVNGDDFGLTPGVNRGIVDAHWLEYATLVARRSHHRSPLVMRCVDDYLGGRRYPLEILVDPE